MKAMLTSFQITTYDQWASGVARPVIVKMGGFYAMYFVSYVFVSSIVIMNVIVAVLLDKYLAGSLEPAEGEDELNEENGETSGALLGVDDQTSTSPAMWATKPEAKVACPCCGHLFDPAFEKWSVESCSVVEAKEVSSVQPIMPQPDDPPVKRDSSVEKAFNSKYIRGAKKVEKVEKSNNMVQPFNSAQSQSPSPPPPVPPEKPQKETEENLDSLSDDGEEKEEDKGLNWQFIDQSSFTLNEALDRVEALMKPHDDVSKKLLKQMKDQLFRDKVESQRRRRREAEVSVLKRLATKFYGNTYTQIFFAGLIFANFIVSAIEAQMLPLTPQERKVFEGFELFFTVIFAAELLINMYANYFLKFWKSAWNWFDFTVVFVSLISLAVDNLPGITVLRLFRAFRVFRLFRRIPSLRKIVMGVASALPGVASAFVLLGLVMGIWSILGVSFFRDEFPDHYGDFFKAMLTSFQIMTFDGWASEVTRPILLKQGGVYGLYFMSYVFIASIFMSNVVIAILLDKYLSATSDVKMRLDDTRESFQKMEQALLGRFTDMEEYLMSNNLKYAFHSMSPMERKLALQSVALDV
jgi:voltage-gated sodium channel